MPVNPSAALQASISGGANQTGGITAALSATVQLVPVSSVGWTSQRYEIYSYPVGFATPAGWTLDGTTGAIYYATSSTPPIFTVTPWGKYLFRLTVNGGLDGNGVASPALLDESCAVDVLSPNGLHDLAWNETTQFSASQKWVAHQKANLRILDASTPYASLAVLQAKSVTGVVDGSVYYTATPRAMRLTLATSAATPDGYRIFSSSAAGRVFFRDTNYGVPGASEVSTWYISGPAEAIPGDNANDGLSAATPIRDVQELNYRLAGQTVVTNVTVYVAGANVTTIWNQRFSPDLAEITFTFVGVRSYVGAVSSTCTMTAWNNATKTVGKMVLGAGNWSSFVGRPVEFTGIANCIGWVTEEIVSGTAITPGPFNLSTLSSVSGSGAQAWRSYTQPSLGRIAVEPTGRGVVVFQDIDFLAPDASASCRVVFNGCRLAVPYRGITVTYNGCHFTGGLSFGECGRLNSCSMNPGVGGQGVYEGWFTPSRVIMVGQNLFRGTTSTWAIELLLGSFLVIGDDSIIGAAGALAIYGSPYGLRGSGKVHVTGVGFLWGIDIPVGGVLVRVPNGQTWTYVTAGNIGLSDLLAVSPAATYAVGAASSVTSTTLPAVGGTANAFGFARDTGTGS